MPDLHGRMFSARGPATAGQLLAIVFVDSLSTAESRAEIESCRALAKEFESLDALLFVVSRPDPSQDLAALAGNVPYVLLVDADGRVGDAFGVGKTHDRRAPIGFAISRNSYVLEVLRSGSGESLAKQALEILKRPEHHPSGQLLEHVAPVLYVPDVFEREFCRDLIDLWSTDNAASGVLGDEGESVIKPHVKVRRDHIIRSDHWRQETQRRLWLRVIPEVHKAFQYELARAEPVRVCCYDAADGGHFAPHRDNVKKEDAYRRFALTVNLNTEEYEGGFLRFPEYGPHLYRPNTGAAVVFSCSLIHEVLPVTKGRRFAVVTRFMGEADYEARRRSMS